MPGVPVIYKGGNNRTYQCPNAAGGIAGGQVVAADQTVTTNGSESVVVAGAAGLKVVGIALNDAAPAGTDPATDAAARPPYVTVARAGSIVGGVTFAAASKLGDSLKAAASGQVTPLVDGTDTDPSLIIGITASASVAANGTGSVEIVR